MPDFPRIKRLPPYVFNITGELKMAARRRGEDIIDMSMGNPDGPTPKHIVDKLIEAVQRPDTHGYSVSKGIYRLRKAIANWYQTRYGVNFDPDSEAIVTIGSKEGLAHGERIQLAAWAFDDGQPRPRFGPGSRSEKFFDRPINGQHPSQRAPVALTVGSQTGLRVSWFVYRGKNAVTFDPEQTKVWEDTRAGANSPWAPRWIAPKIPDDGKVDTTVTFHEPGTYVLRCLASDGAIGSTHDITFTVTK